MTIQAPRKLMCLKVLLKGEGKAGDLMYCYPKKNTNQGVGYAVAKNIMLIILLGKQSL